MARQGFEWAVTKSGPPPEIKQIGKDDYAQHGRASTVYTHFISGFAEEEIVKFLNAQGIECSLEEIEMDIQHIQSLLPTRTLISHENDRNRILIQRTEGKKYRQLLNTALSLEAKDYLAVGLSPHSVMKEYREATGMQEKPGGINVHVDQRSLSIGGGATPPSGVNSSEDLLRRVMSKMQSRQVALPETIEPEGETIEAEATEVAPTEGDVFEDSEDESIPDPDE
jgi:hypothetical protein